MPRTTGFRSRSGTGLLPGLLALALMPVGAALVWWARRAYGRLLGEVVRTWAEHDPGPSPVAWIADEVWRQRNRFDPELDAADELRSQIDRSVRPFRDAAQGAFESPTLRPVSDAERGLAEIASKNAFSVGDRLELIHPSGNAEIRVERLIDAAGEPVERVPGSDHRVWLPLPSGCVGAFVARFL